MQSKCGLQLFRISEFCFSSMSSTGAPLIDEANFVLFSIRSLKIVSSESNVIRIREFQNRFVGTRKTTLLVDHVSDLSSSLGFLIFSVDLFL